MFTAKKQPIKKNESSPVLKSEQNTQETNKLQFFNPSQKSCFLQHQSTTRSNLDNDKDQGPVC